MSAAFALDYSGDPVPCDFRGCILNAWHEGDHDFAKPVAIGGPKITYHFSPAYEGKEWIVPLLCTCPQRQYIDAKGRIQNLPHELSTHSEIRSEWYAHKRNLSWPWSLMASVREEPSTERKAA